MLVNVHARPDANASSKHINIHKLDTLYLDGGFFASERLGFAHFDVEGSEEDLLLGAQRVSCSATGRPSRSNSRYARGTRARRASSPRRG